MSRMNVFKEIRELNLPFGQYVVVGGAIMAAHGIKDTQDVDLVVTEDLFEKLKQRGWKEHKRPNGEPGLEYKVFEAYLDVNCGNHNPKTEDLIAGAEIINGVPFISLEELIKFKKEYARPKDLEHIKTIEQHLEGLENS